MHLAMSAQPGGLALLCFLLGLQGSLAAGMVGAGEGGWRFPYEPVAVAVAVATLPPRKGAERPERKTGGQTL